MPGHRNPFRLSGFLDQMCGAMSKAKSDIRNATTLARDKNISFVDLNIQFIGASGLPKMDVVGSADPYFVARLDDKIHFVSAVKSDTLTPVWNESWNVKNVPATATLSVLVMDKDSDAPTDDYIGKFETTVQTGTREVRIEAPLLKRSRGDFFLKIHSVSIEDRAKQDEAKKPSEEQNIEAAIKQAVEHATSHPYLFDGPIRYSCHFSPTVGRLTNINDARLYSTWKLYIMGIPEIFGDRVQHWNRDYKAARRIFQGPTSIIVRSSIQAGHRMLYARTTRNGFGTIHGPDDMHSLLRGATRDESGHYFTGPHRVKPAVYTYIIAIDDESFRFSETGAAFFVDFASKHALHSNCAEAVRYSGEFHPRPEGGWENLSDETPDEEVKWELVIDNNSGTYSPDKSLLPLVKKLLDHNFPGFTIIALDHEDQELKKSVDACRAYALSKRGVREDELQPHAADGEVTLRHLGTQYAHQMKDFVQHGAEWAISQIKADVANMKHPRVTEATGDQPAA